jgi:hydrogenase maturation protease
VSGEAIIVIIGLGNRMRSDDGAGIEAARHIKRLNLPGVSVFSDVADSAALIELWVEAEIVYIVDAVSSGHQAGTIVRYDALSDVIPEEIFTSLSSHSFGLGTTIQIARELNRLPRKLIVYGIEGKDFAAGDELTPDVERAALDASQRIVKEILADIPAPQ